jgi:hypothetical protein
VLQSQSESQDEFASFCGKHTVSMPQYFNVKFSST